MSGKSEKRLRRTMRKFSKQVFKDFAVEISCMPFWTRFMFCLRMAFLRHELQRGMRDEIEARRTHTADGEEK